METLEGIMQKGFIAKVGNKLHKTMEAVKRHSGIKDAMVSYAPHVTKAIISKIPGMKHLAQPIAEGVQKVITHHHNKQLQHIKNENENISSAIVDPIKQS